MNLDLPTLIATGAFFGFCAGTVLLAAWSVNRQAPALGFWGLGDISASAGLGLLLAGGVSQLPLVSIAGGCLLTLAQALGWKAARSFDGKPAPLWLVLLGPAISACANLVPGLRDFGPTLGLLISAIYLIAIVSTLWAGRADRLPARWALMGFTAVHAFTLLLGARSAFIGDVDQDLMPPVMSAFGLVHFESIVFAFGTAVFLLALVKERAETASRLAAGMDSLTGISNRAAFTEAAIAGIERCRRDHAPVAVIMFDLDRFKAVNDTYGHAVGDAVIRKFCKVTMAALRPGDVFGRLGGEEFAVMMARSSIEPAMVRAERIRAAFAESCRIVGDQMINATVSGGVAVSADAAMTLSALLKLSDEALYQAKAAGRNRIRRDGQLGLDGGASVIRVA
jgi:diguanylate cyclase (GGDEF)-like protein